MAEGWGHAPHTRLRGAYAFQVRSESHPVNLPSVNKYDRKSQKCQLLNWLVLKDSNLHKKLQRLLCYHYTKDQWIVNSMLLRQRDGFCHCSNQLNSADQSWFQTTCQCQFTGSYSHDVMFASEQLSWIRQPFTPLSNFHGDMMSHGDMFPLIIGTRLFSWKVWWTFQFGCL